MNDSRNRHADDAIEPSVAELIGRYFEGDLSADDAAALSAALAADAALRDLFAAVALQRRLASRMTATAAGAAPADAAVSPKPRPAAQRGPGVGFRMAPAFTLAALLLLAAAAVAIYIFVFNSKLETRNPKLVAPAPLASILETSGDGTLVADNRIANPGDEIGPGELALDTGSADFRLTNGVGVTIRGDTHLTVHGPMSATLTRGAATFDCPVNATGYTVHLPAGAKVVDLGTRFEVRIEPDGSTVLRVTDGVVEARGSDARVDRVVAGQVASADADGVWHAPARPGLISLASAPLSADGIQIASDGTLLAAWNVNGNATVVPVVNGIAFANDRPGCIVVTGFPASVQDDPRTEVHYTPAALKQIIGDFLATTGGAPGTLTLTGLTVGKTYRLQVLHHQDVDHGTIRTMAVHFGTAAGPGSGSFDVGDDAGRITTAIFTADAGEQTFTLRVGSNDRAMLNGVVLHETPTARTPTPPINPNAEPTPAE